MLIIIGVIVIIIIIIVIIIIIIVIIIHHGLRSEGGVAERADQIIQSLLIDRLIIITACAAKVASRKGRTAKGASGPEKTAAACR